MAKVSKDTKEKETVLSVNTGDMSSIKGKIESAKRSLMTQKEEKLISQAEVDSKMKANDVAWKQKLSNLTQTENDQIKKL